MKFIAKLLPSFGAVLWLLWYCVQAKWSEVIAPNFGWLVLATVISTGIICWLTEKKESKTLMVRKKEESIAPQEKLVAREIYTWKTVTRERSVYAKSK